MTDLPFTDPSKVRYFEDYLEGERHNLGIVSATKDEMLAFAKSYDPQKIHTDPAWAAAGPFGGIIASGWQTCGLMMKQFVAHYLSDESSLSSPGIDDLKWLAPVRPGDQLEIFVTITEARRSKSKPDRGIIKSLVEVINQDGVTVMTIAGVNLIAARPDAE